MSKEFIEAEMRLFMEQCKEVDIVITTVSDKQLEGVDSLVQLPTLGSHPRKTSTNSHNQRYAFSYEARIGDS
jgi:hypothetical protein